METKMYKKQTSNEKRFYIPLELTPETVITEAYKDCEVRWSKIGCRKVRTVLIQATEEQYREMEKLGAEINETLKAAMAAKEPAGDLAQKTADLHRRWLAFTWEKYSKEAHAGLAQMYVDDERFTAYYDKLAPGMTIFLRDAVLHYLNNN